MHQFLRRESVFSQNGAVLSNFFWFSSNIPAYTDDPLMMTGFFLSNFAGISAGQTKTGVVIQYALCFMGYVAMGGRAMITFDGLKFLTCVGGLMATSKMILDNLDGSWFARKMPMLISKNKTGFSLEKMLHDITGFPAKIVVDIGHVFAASSGRKKQKIGAIILDIATRPMFKGALFGALWDSFYIISGFIKGDLTEIATGILWMGGYTLVGIATPKDGQKNIFRIWYQSLRAKF